MRDFIAVLFMCIVVSGGTAIPLVMGQEADDPEPKKAGPVGAERALKDWITLDDLEKVDLYLRAN
jgi:hypothetical protein